MLPKISIIIPAYNEKIRILPYLEEINSYIKKTDAENKEIFTEVLIIDDGSSDSTPEVVNSFCKDKEKFQLISHDKNQGKGAAIKTGAKNAKEDLMLFTDADGSSAIKEVEKLLPFLHESYDIIFGSRAMGAKLEARFYRKFLGRVFNLFVKLLLFPNVKDSQCGFKLINLKTARDVVQKIQETGFSFDLELLHLAHLKGLTFKEVPIEWHHVDGSKINVLTDGVKMLGSIFKIKKRNLFQ